MTSGFAAVTPELWVRQCRSMHYNTGVFISQGQAVLIDPGLMADEFAALRELLAAHGARPHTLVVTHSHWDHVLGPEQFPGVRVLAHDRYPALIAQYADDIAWGLSHWEKQAGLTRSQPFRPPAADVTVGADAELTVGALALRLRHVPGHAPDQLALYDAAAGALWASDILSDVEIPYVSDSLAAYQRTLAELAGWDLRVLVPGHGTPTAEPAEIQARLAHDRAYLAELGERVAAAVAAGRSVEAAVAACADMDFRLKAASQFDHQLNVESVFLELGGAADPQRVGWNKNWQTADIQWEPASDQ